MKEEFRFINDYTVPNIIPERYMISNYGRVYDRLVNHYVDFIPDQSGYPAFVVDYYIDWDRIDSIAIRVCDAMMRTFNLIPNYISTQIRHVDGNRNNFKKNNLEWFDPDNIPTHIVETICNRLQSGAAMNHLSEMFDIPIDIIKDIRDGKRYVYIRRKFHINKKRMNVLLPGQVREICSILEKNPNISSEDLAGQMNCTLAAVEGVRSGKTYTRISNDYSFKRKLSDKQKAEILSDDDIREICETFIRRPDLNNYQIAMIMKCKPTQVRDIRLRKVHKNIVKDYNW
jgi:hypothetical protein